MENEDDFPDQIEMPDGTFAVPDYEDFFKIVEFFASTYGLGAHMTLTSFARMINEQDPVMLKCLFEAGIERETIKWGGKPKEKTTKVYSKTVVTDTGSEQIKLAQMLIDFGTPKKQVDEALAKIKSGQIKVPTRDYSWLTSDQLVKGGFDLKAVMKQMSDDEKNSINFKVSMNTLLNKGKKNG